MINWFQRHAYWIKWVISIGLLVIIFLRIDINYFLDAFKTVGWEYYVFLVILYFCLQMISALKWKVLLPDHSFGELFRLILISNFYMFIIPSTFTGDATRVIKADKKDKGNTEVITSIFVDKWLGLLALVVLMLTSFGFYSVKKAGIFFIPVVLLCITMFVATYLLYRGSLLKITTKILKQNSSSTGKVIIFVTKLNKLFISIEDAAKNTQAISYNLLLALLFQLGIAVSSFVLGIEMELNLNYWDFCLITCILQLVLLLPLSIAGIGAKDASIIAMFVMAGISKETALAFSLVSYPVTILLVFVGYSLDHIKR